MTDIRPEALLALADAYDGPYPGSMMEHANRQHVAKTAREMQAALRAIAARDASPAHAGDAGWLRRAVDRLLPNWNLGRGTPVRGSVVKGVPDVNHCDPRFGIKQWDSLGGDLAVSLMVGNDHSKGGRWIEQRFTPEQCIQIVASILSKPAIEPVVGPLLAALFAAREAAQFEAGRRAAQRVADDTLRSEGQEMLAEYVSEKISALSAAPPRDAQGEG
jgi:hypothetical protein